MSFRPLPNTEPIPGYTLVDRLGAGGYGEVWKATAPGGLLKAVKFVYGLMEDARAGQEVKALQRIKGVRHPFLLSLERVEVVDGQLIIVSELADECMIDRFEAWRKDGHLGIPRDTLLGYLRDIADALDYMADTYGLQHLDIKPGNLLLVGGRVKVADFGLVKELRGEDVTASGGVSPAYAPAEFFDGRVSRYSDQYSLAIVYQEMLCGVRPFPGATAVQLALQHTTGKPLLDPLPFHDRPIVARALSKDPNERFPSCNDFVKALVEAPKSRQAEQDSTPQTPLPLSCATDLPTEEAQTPPRKSEEDVTDPLLTHGPPLLRFANAGENDDFGREITKVRPTLFLGIGGLGTTTLRRLRHKLKEATGGRDAAPMLRFLAIDTDRSDLRPSSESIECSRQSTDLDYDETLYLPIQKPEHYKAQSREILRWLDRRWLFALPKSQRSEGVRPLGRLALLDHADKVRQALSAELALLQTTSHAPLGTLRSTSESPRVVLISSICGGTGSAMVIDLLHQIRDLLEEQRLPIDSITALLLYASSPKPAEKEVARANAYATLTELHHALSPDADYPGEPSLQLPSRMPQGDLVRDCYVVHLGEDLDLQGVQSAVGSVAEYLLLDCVTSCGSVLEGHRQETRWRQSSQEEATVRSFGLYRIAFPRQELAQVAAKICCQRLLARWHGDLDPVVDAEGGDPIWSMSYRTNWLREIGEAEAMHLWQCLEIQDDRLLGQFTETTSDLLHGDADRGCQGRIREAFAKAPRGASMSDVASLLLREIDLLLGTGYLPDSVHSAAPSEFENHVLQDARAKGEQEAERVVAHVQQTVGNPQRRLKPALAGAEWLTHRLLTRIETVQGALVEAERERLDLRLRLCGTSSLSGRKFPWKPATLSDAQQVALEYSRARLAELGLQSILECLRQLYRRSCVLLQQLMDARQEVARLAESLLVNGGVQANQSHVASAPCILELLPGHCKSFLESGLALAKNLSSTSFFDDLEERLEREVFEQAGGLWKFFEQPTPPQPLTVELSRTVLASVLLSLETLDAASLFFEHHSGMGGAIRHLKQLIGQAKPPLSFEGSTEHLVLGVPNSPCGRTLRELVAAQVPGDAVTAVAVPGDVVFCLESAGLPISAIADQIIAGESTLIQVSRRLLTRIDIDWPPLERSSLVAR